MRYFLKLVLFTIVVISSYCCCSKKEISTKLPEAIDQVYFQKWVGGQEFSGSGIDFHLKFKNQLPQDTYLSKVYFQNQEAFFERENETTFVAKFYSKPLIAESTDGVINKKENPDFPFDLQPTEAILEFHINNKAAQVKIENIQEKELIAYPSTRPRN